MILEDADTCHNQWYHGHGTWCTSDHENRAQKDHTYKDKCIEECMWDPTDKDWLGLCVRSVLLVLRICSWIKHNQKCMKYFEFILYVTPVFWNRSIEDLKGSKVTFLGKTLCQDVVNRAPQRGMPNAWMCISLSATIWQNIGHDVKTSCLQNHILRALNPI